VVFKGTPIIHYPEPDVSVFNSGDIVWRDASKPGLMLAPVHENRETGHFLGLLGFEPMTSSGLHQHTSAAFSYMLSGSIRDYGGKTRPGEMGINLAGATHDAIAFERSIVASRLDGHVLYADQLSDEDAPHLHAGGRLGQFDNERPADAPTLNVPVEEITPAATRIAGVTRRLISDYKGTGLDFRNAALTLRPGTRLPVFRTSAPIELFLIAGDLEFNGKFLTSGGFAILEGHRQFQMGSSFGAFLIAWAEGPVEWQDTPADDLFGFPDRPG
jgi:hypothetical protein